MRSSNNDEAGAKPHVNVFTANPSKPQDIKNLLFCRLKDNYYTNYFTKCKNNLKATWKLIGTIIKRKTKGQCYPTKIIRHNKTYTEQRDIANQFNEHFVKAGPHLAETIPSTNKHYNDYTRYSCPSSFVMSPVTEMDVHDLLSTLNELTLNLNSKSNVEFFTVVRSLNTLFFFFFFKPFQIHRNNFLFHRKQCPTRKQHAPLGTAHTKPNKFILILFNPPL